MSQNDSHSITIVTNVARLFTFNYNSDKLLNQIAVLTTTAADGITSQTFAMNCSIK
jgi:hypothetical protein